MKSLGSSGPVGRDWFGLDHFQPGPRFTREGSRLYLLDDVGSTNDFLLGRGESALGRVCQLNAWGWSALDQEIISPLKTVEHGLVCVARRQSTGKGRQGRRWVDCGGLNLSVVIPSHRAAFDKGFSVWLGLMVVLCLREDFGVDARLKWPNDIMSGERKLGGLLLENQIMGDSIHIIAGLGLNLLTRADQFPAALQGLATSVYMETGRKIRPADIAGQILLRVEDEVDRFDTAGWKPYSHALACLDCLLGREIRLQVGTKEMAGRSRGIDPHGALLLETAEGQVQSLAAGEVHVLHRTDDSKESKS